VKGRIAVRGPESRTRFKGWKEEVRSVLHWTTFDEEEEEIQTIRGGIVLLCGRA